MAHSVPHTTKRVDLPVEDRIGAYTVLGKVGEGGMATVYRVKGPGGKVHALKELRPQREARREMERRFKQEFEVTANLSHRNIVEVRDFFAAQETLHLVMEWVDGPDLRDVLKFAGTLGDGILAYIGAEIASGLAAAHGQGVLHRDLKPENVLMNRRGQTKIADFGVARVTGTRLTATGIIVGSPAYMSPEQLAGVSGQRLAAASDVYSLGVMLYELGEGKDPLSLRKHEDLLTVLKAKREKRPRRMKRIADPDLQGLILECLEPEPEHRPVDMEIVARRLRRIARRAMIARADTRHLVDIALTNREQKKRSQGEVAPSRPRDEPSAPWDDIPSAADELEPEPPAPAPEPVAVERPRRRPRAPARPEPPPVPPPEAWDRADRRSRDRDFGSGSRRLSRLTDLSVKRRGARGETSLLAWAVLLLLAAAVVFLGASASLTGSPLGLLEVLVPLP